MLYYLAILPSKNISNKINDLRKRYQSKTRSVPHITIIPPFSVNTSEDLLVQNIKKSIKYFEKFELRLCVLDIFSKDNGDVVLFLKVNDQNTLKKLYNTIIRNIKYDIANPQENFTHLFHITILKKISLTKILEAKKELSIFDFNQGFEAKELILFRIKKNEPWKILKRIALKGVND